MRRPLALVISATLGMTLCAWPGADAVEPPPEEAIDLAIALDTSQSMEWLIDSARITLWQMVDDLAMLEPRPTLRVAVLSYGTGRNNPRAGWVRVESDLTTDVDLVFDRLMALTSSGGEEYVGRVIQTALDDLSWTDSEEALKVIVVVGNEKADQDPRVDYRDMILRARDAGIQVNAIFCGPSSHVDARSWTDLAEYSQGTLAFIDPNAPVAIPQTPYDDEIVGLATELRGTSLRSEEVQERGPVAGDRGNRDGALGLAAGATRARLLAESADPAEQDLRSALESGTIESLELDGMGLPADLREKSPEERARYIEGLLERRADLRERILRLSDERWRYKTAEAPQEAEGTTSAGTLDAALRRILRQSLATRGFVPRED